MNRYSYDRQAAELAGFKIDPDLAWAYADAWPKTTLTNAYLRPAIAQKVKQVSPHSADAILWNNKNLIGGWTYNVAMEVRDLNFRSRKWLTPQQYIALMTDVCPRYNGFSIKKVAKALLDPDAKDIQVQAAREMSPALYIKGPPDVLDWFRMVAGPDVMKSDEEHLRGDELRLWWD